MKKQVMTIAHQIKGLFNSFAEALKAAWIIVKLNMGFSVRIAFAKDTGEIREALAIATGSLSTIEKGYIRFVEQVSEGRTQWRSFKIGRIIL